jgi:hypothetical protein
MQALCGDDGAKLRKRSRQKTRPHGSFTGKKSAAGSSERKNASAAIGAQPR